MASTSASASASAAVVASRATPARPSTSGNNGNLNHHPSPNHHAGVQRNNSSAAAKSPSPRSIVSPHVPEVREYLFKLLVIGELGTGKTSFIKRYVHQYFSQHYRATIGVDFALKVLNWDDNTLIRVQLWDIAGQERFGNMTRVYYKEAVGAFLVFDVNSPQTFNAIIKWKHDLDTKVCLADGNPIPCLLLANKCDSPKEGPAANPEALDKFARDNNFCGWFYTSAKENINVEEASKFLVGKILQRQKHFVMEDHPGTSDVISLDYSRHAQSTQPKKCGC